MNTEQFDGHTPGPWTLSTEGSATGNAVRWISDVCTDLLGASDADAQLMAAAPDLFAEVKRLRNLIERVIKNLRYTPPYDIEEYEYQSEMLSYTEQMICHTLEILEGRE